MKENNFTSQIIWNIINRIIGFSIIIFHANFKYQDSDNQQLNLLLYLLHFLEIV